MAIETGRWIRSALLVGFGIAVGAAGGVAVYRKLHPTLRPRPEMSGRPGSGSLAPPEMPLDNGAACEQAVTGAAAQQAPKVPDTVPAEPPEVVAVMHPVVIPVAAVVLPDIPANVSDVGGGRTSEGPEYFGFVVGSVVRAPEVDSASTLLHLRLMKNRCIAGFDGKSSVLDFSGWTKAMTGELTYEKGRLVETARGSVTADAATIETGDADRDQEIRDKHLETAKFPLMKFAITCLKLTGPGKINLSGVMEIHGQKKDVTLPCTFLLRKDGFAYMKGEIKLNMSEFGIEPPVKLGVIKVEDQIRIWFEIWAEPVKECAK